ncbi:hypothetical protein NL676_005601 [Syzygium grande]|nr:hypothetical protein NL676_005601 [Syzygium grande]
MKAYKNYTPDEGTRYKTENASLNATDQNINNTTPNKANSKLVKLPEIPQPLAYRALQNPILPIAPLHQQISAALPGDGVRRPLRHPNLSATPRDPQARPALHQGVSINDGSPGSSRSVAFGGSRPFSPSPEVAMVNLDRTRHEFR